MDLIIIDIQNANIYSFSDRKGRFVLIDDVKALEILERLGEHSLVKELQSKHEVTNFGNPAWTEPHLASSQGMTNQHESPTQGHQDTTEHTHDCGCSQHDQQKPK